jgi:hypothetical protein
MRSAVVVVGVRPALGSLLLLLWVVVMGTAVSFPLFVPLRELLEPAVPPMASVVVPYVASLVTAGAKVATGTAHLLAAAFGWETAVPPGVDAWLLAARRLGELIGVVAAATVPAWAITVWSRRRLARSGRHVRLRHLPLAIATVWTIVVAHPLVGAVGRVAFPVETWLMLPSAAAARDEVPAAPGWCAYHLHPSHFACEAHRLNSHARRADSSVRGFVFTGARCVSAADVPHPGCTTPASG